MRDDGKLRVPAPDETNDEETFDGAIVVGAAISLLAGLAIFLVQYERGSAKAGHGGGSGTVTGGAHLSVSDRLERLAEKQGPRRLAARDWTNEEMVEAFASGPAPVAEAVCRGAFEQMRTGGLNSEADAELAAAIDRRAPHVPWPCLIDAYLQDRISSELKIYAPVQSMWTEMRAFAAPRAVTEAVVSAWKERVGDASPETGSKRTAELPDSGRFDQWIRLCALNFDSPAGPACREILAELAPRHGADLLGVVETHLQAATPNPNYDLPILIDGLRRLASLGQPEHWRIEQTEELPVYDLDVRIGATFYLCRFLHSSQRDVALRAAHALSEVAGVSVRAVDSGLLPRWRKACRLAFQTGGSKQQPSAPALEVHSDEKGRAPDYTLEDVIERGHCEVRAGHPRWYCASMKWQGSGPEDLSDFFVATRGIDQRGWE